ncbi:hypothetical protein B7494_g6785 [Chlorociboria aeruginascens]|nr:hypothetical protein B7494_g6785 [Chlorociboria aeruginascens]
MAPSGLTQVDQLTALPGRFSEEEIRARTEEFMNEVRAARALARKDTKQFTPFKKLPPEIRQKIWSIDATANPRIILCQSSMKAKTPAILHVNQEARWIALKHFTKLQLYPFSRTKRIYINIDLDTIFFGDAEYQCHSKLIDPIIMHSQELSRVKHIAMTDAVFKVFIDNGVFQEQREKMLEGALKSVTIVWNIERGMKLTNKSLVIQKDNPRVVTPSDWFVRPDNWKERLEGKYREWKGIDVTWATAKKDVRPIIAGTRRTFV